MSRSHQTVSSPPKSGQGHAAGHNASQQSDETTRKNAEDTWVKSVRQWFPRLHEQTYFVPSIFIRRVPSESQEVAGEQAHVPKRPHTDREEGMRASGRKRRKQAAKAAKSAKSGGGETSQSGDGVRKESPAGKAWIQASTGRGVPPAPVFESDERDDRTQELVLFSLEQMTRRQRQEQEQTQGQTQEQTHEQQEHKPKQPAQESQQEVMVVVSQLKFGRYLGEPTYAAAAQAFARPETLHEKYKQGDFDVLMIHRYYGIVVAEIKSVGSELENITCQQDKDKAIVKRVDTGVGQLNKAKEVLRHVTKDLADTIRVTPTLILPNISSSQLSQALSSDADILQHMCQCLGVGNLVEAVSKCLCKDQMPTGTTPDDVTDEVLDSLRAWWHNIVSDDQAMTSSIYEHLVARFCGPATTVEVPVVSGQRLAVPLRTSGEATAETGRRMAQLTLLPEQIHLINSDKLPKIFLTGPPGTGKTVVLGLVGKRWFLKGHDVHLLASWLRANAAIFLLKDQLKPLQKKHGPRVYTHFFDFTDPQSVTKAVRTLKKKAVNGQLFVIADEAGPDDSGSEAFQKFCNTLDAAVGDLHLWAAAVQHVHRPSCLVEKTLTVPLRCPPLVVQEVRKAKEFGKNLVYPYTQESLPAPTDGPKVKHLRHVQNEQGHDDQLFPKDCQKCGRKIAQFLERLGVRPAGQGSLEYRDVLVLCHDPRDVRVDESDHVTSQATAVITGLRKSGLPVRVVQRDDASKRDVISDIALAKSDEVVVTDFMLILGLERRVVIGVGHVGTSGVYDELLCMSRCTGQLVWVATPHKVHDHEDSGGHTSHGHSHSDAHTHSHTHSHPHSHPHSHTHSHTHSHSHPHSH